MCVSTAPKFPPPPPPTWPCRVVTACTRSVYSAGRAPTPTLVARALKLPRAATILATVGVALSVPANRSTTVDKLAISVAVAVATATPSLVRTNAPLASTLSSSASSLSASTFLTSFTTGELST